MLFQWIFIQSGPHTWENIINHRLWTFRVPWSLGFVLGLPPRGGSWKQSKWPWDTIHSMPCRNSCRILHPSRIHALRWSLKRSGKRTWTGSVFPTNGRCLKCTNGNGLSVSCGNWEVARLFQLVLLSPMIRENWQLVTNEPVDIEKITGWSSRLQENYRSFPKLNRYICN